MYCFTLNESILYSFRLALFISIYPVNGFLIANYLQNLYQDTFCSCMTGPSVHNTQSAFGLYQQVFYLKEGNSQQGPAEGWLIMILEQSFVGMTGYFYWPQVLMLLLKETAGWEWRVLPYHTGNPVLDPISA